MRPRYLLKAGSKKLVLGSRTRLMGVINVTPDSFYDGGRFWNTPKAIDHCLQLADAGADILDIGGQSSRPGSRPVSPEEERERVVPVIEKVSSQVDAILSVDTYRSVVASEAIASGADMVNDISALRFDPKLAQVIAEKKASVVLMHMRGTPETMQEIPPSVDIIQEIQDDLEEAISHAVCEGIPRDRILLDPGIGFGKTLEDNLKILNRLSLLQRFKLPILVGASRKSFLGKLLDQPEEERLLGTAAAVAASAFFGAHVVRVHDVQEMRDIVRVVDAIREEGLE